ASFFLVYLDSVAINDFINQQKVYNGNYWQHGTELTWLLGLPCWLLGVKLADELDRISNTSTGKIYTVRLLVFIAAFICSFARFHLSLSYTISLTLFAILSFYWIKSEIGFWNRS